MKLISILGALATTFVMTNLTFGEEVPQTAMVVRAEALRANLDPAGRPLPLVAQWHMAHTPLDFQLELIRRGHHLLPFIPLPNPGSDLASKKSKLGSAVGPTFEDQVKQLAAWQLPVAIIGTQWEGVLTDHEKKWRSLPPEQSALVWSALADAASSKPTLKMLSPFGAIPPWEEVGRYWTDTPGMKKLQELYPNPPLVLMVSNNEASRLRWHDVEIDKRYLEKYGTDKSDDFKRQVLGDGWIERYRAMFSGMRNGLMNDNWKNNVRFMGYNSFGPDNFGRGEDWKRWSTTTNDRVSWNWHVWDGGTHSAYDNHWEFKKNAFSLWSCQIEKFNSVFMKEEALKANPSYWLETVFWDGHQSSNQKKDDSPPGKEKDKYIHYERLGVPYTPELYRGWVQYVMWTVQPRVAREWRSSGDHPRDPWWPRFSQIIRAVDLVHADPVLSRFWRNGRLVANHAHEHPFKDAVPEKWQNTDRWFALDTSADPPRPWDLNTRLPVLALARVIGDQTQREWLLYAHAPLGDRNEVEVSIPEYRKVRVNVNVGGSFYHITEGNGLVKAVGDISKVVPAPVELSSQ